MKDKKTDIEVLKDIFLADDIDSEDYDANLQYITEWQKALIDNENLLGWQENDITKELIKRAKTAYQDLSMKLIQDRILTDIDRISIYGKQDAMLWIMNIAGEDPTTIINQINDDIKKALNATN